MIFGVSNENEMLPVINYHASEAASKDYYQLK